MRCLEPSEIERYVSGLMDRKVADEVTSHLETCQRCRRAVAEARERVAAPDGDRGTIRVQCSGCGARYGIPEDRARGRVLKVRCKSCGTILEVRGASSPGRSVLDRSRKQWFLVIHRERVGPMTDVEVRERFQKGEIRPRTYAWRQGFTRWERLQSIPELQDLLVAPAAPEKPKRSTKPLAELGITDSARTLPAKARADAEVADDAEEGLDFDAAHDTAQKTVDIAASNPGRGEDTARMEAGVAAALLAVKSDAGQPVVPTDEHETQLHVKGRRDPLAGFDPVPLGFDISKPEPGASAFGQAAADPSPLPAAERSQLAPGEFERHMRGQRSEDSVLFSLNHLKQIAAKPTVKPKQASGFTGLFDIRPLQVGPPPVMLPVESSGQSRVSVWLVLGVGVAGVVVGAVTLFGMLYLVRPELVRDLINRRPPTLSGPGTGEVAPVVTPLGAGSAAARDASRPPAPGTGSGATVAQPAPPKKEEPRPEPKTVVAKADPKPAAKVEAKVEKKPLVKPEAKPVARPVKKVRRKRQNDGIEVVDPGEGAVEAKKEPDAPPPEAPAVEKPAPKPKKKNDEEELDRLIDGATDKPIPKKKAAEAKPEQPEPKKEEPALRRDQIAAGMRKAVGAVQICNEKFAKSGMVTVDVTIEPSGRISRGRVLGPFADSAVGVCVLEAVKRNASFPSFSGSPISIQYPFMLKQ